jgi:hypothetical protein
MEAVDIFLLIFALLLLTGCQSHAIMEGCCPGGDCGNQYPDYYEIECDDDGCRLVPKLGEPPVGAEVTGQTEDGVDIVKPEAFPSRQQWEQVIGRPLVIEHNDPSNPNNTLGYTKDGVEIRGPLKTIYLETE